MSKIRVAVVRGGPSSEYEKSLATGAYVLSLLRDLEKYEPIDIFISKSGEWHRDGIVNESHQALNRKVLKLSLPP
jgi:D-alanine-D-alanine ligase-like ATP-grasp enzyme